MSATSLRCPCPPRVPYSCPPTSPCGHGFEKLGIVGRLHELALPAGQELPRTAAQLRLKRAVALRIGSETRAFGRGQQVVLAFVYQGNESKQPQPRTILHELDPDVAMKIAAHLRRTCAKPLS